MTGTKGPREWWITLDPTVNLCNRKHHVMDKEQHDELYFNDAEGYEFFEKKNPIVVVEKKELDRVVSERDELLHKSFMQMGRIENLESQLTEARAEKSARRCAECGNEAMNSIGLRLLDERDDLQSQLTKAKALVAILSDNGEIVELEEQRDQAMQMCEKISVLLGDHERTKFSTDGSHFQIDIKIREWLKDFAEWKEEV